jgi:uncharacterized cupredoxin-like copper-binding protein
MHTHLTRRRLLQLASAATLSGAIFQAVGPAVLAQKDPAGADLEIRMGEFYFEVPGQGKNAPITLEAEKELLIRLVNEGGVVHEIHFGRNADLTARLYQEELMPGFLGLHLEPTQQALLHVRIPADRKGTWEIGCLIAGHYEAGQKAQLNIS